MQGVMLDIVAMILIVVEENLPFGVLWTPWCAWQKKQCKRGCPDCPAPTCAALRRALDALVCLAAPPERPGCTGGTCSAGAARVPAAAAAHAVLPPCPLMYCHCTAIVLPLYCQVGPLLRTHVLARLPGPRVLPLLLLHVGTCTATVPVLPLYGSCIAIASALGCPVLLFAASGCRTH